MFGRPLITASLSWTTVKLPVPACRAARSTSTRPRAARLGEPIPFSDGLLSAEPSPAGAMCPTAVPMTERIGIDVERGTPEPSPLRVGVLASIAHRTPPRGYGPWEQVASTLAEGLVALGHEVTLFATADSITAGPAARRSAARLRGGPGGRREGVRGPAQRRRLRTGRRVRRHQQPVRLPAADLQPPGVDTGRHDHPRLLVRANRAGLPRVQRHRALRRDQRRRPAPGPGLRGDDPSRHPPRPTSPSAKSPAATCSSSAASTPTRAPTTRSRWPGARGCRWSSPGSSRTRTTSPTQVRPHLAAPGITYVGPVGPAGA